MGKKESKKYPKAVWYSVYREVQVQVRKLHEQVIKHMAWQQSTENSIDALEVQLRGKSCPEEGDVMNQEGRTPK